LGKPQQGHAVAVSAGLFRAAGCSGSDPASRSPWGYRSSPEVFTWFRSLIVCGFLLAPLVASPRVATAQESIVSMGQPSRLWPYAGASLALNQLSDESAVGGTVSLGVQRPLMNPLTGGPTLALEGYVGGAGGSISGVDGGFRAAMALPILFTQFGVDWNLRVDRAQFFMSVIFPPIRGGLLGRGGQLRVDWVPARDQTVQLGFNMPLGQPWIGKTRPRRIEARLPEPPDEDRAGPPAEAEGRAILEGVRDYAMRLGRWGFPISWTEGDSYENAIARADSIYTRMHDELLVGDALSPDGHSAPGDRAVYLREMDRLFSWAAGDASLGPVIADSARAMVLEEVFLPYNSLMAQYKEPDGLYGRGGKARSRFADWVSGQAGVEPGQSETVLAAYDGWFESLEAVRNWILDRGRGDSRGTWLPMQLVLRPEQHDTRQEIDEIIERAVGAGFVGGNAAVYIAGQQFQLELTKQIHAAEDYHVLWIHDYRGRTPEGRTDIVGFHQTVQGYLAALTARVREYDRTGHLPVYLLFFDQNYYRKPDRGSRARGDAAVRGAAGGLAGQPQERRRVLETPAGGGPRAGGSEVDQERGEGARKHHTPERPDVPDDPDPGPAFRR
jgi:hypothetical protein